MLPSQTPIHKLPSEIMLLIIQRAVHEGLYWVGTEYPHSNEDPIQTGFSQQSESLALICSRWRTIALSCPMLWTRIELSANNSTLPTLLARAELRIERSGRLPLELYIDDVQVQCPHLDFDYDYKPLKQVLVRAARRMSAFKFVIYQVELGPFHSGVFEYIISACSPGQFKELIIIDKNGPPRGPGSVGGRLVLAHNEPLVWAPAPWVPQHRNVNLPLRKQELDNIVSGLETLYLQGIFLNWMSAGYRGLVDLRLTAPPIGYPCYIRELDLVSVLTASPGLRVLYISLAVSYLSQDEPIPVPLRDLETLRVFAHHTEKFPVIKHSNLRASSVLRLIAPGSKPLHLFLGTGVHPHGFEPCFSDTYVKEFFQRSKITKLCVQSGILSVNELFYPGYAPDLKILVTSHCTIDSWVSESLQKLTPRLQSWYLHECIIDDDQLRHAVEMCPTGIVLSKCTVEQYTMEPRLFGFKVEEMTEEEILLAFPTIRFLTDARNLTLSLNGENIVI